MSLRYVLLVIRRRSTVLLMILLLGFYLIWFSIVGQRSLDQPDNSAFHHRLLDELSVMRLQAAMMRQELVRLGVDPYRWQHEDLPVIYVITPTNAVPTQKADLTRMLNTLRHVPNVHWILVEDAADRSASVRKLLINSGVVTTHLNALTPSEFKLSSRDPRWRKPRGVIQRNAAIQWLQQNVEIAGANGVVYFADDDNTYSLELFSEMRNVQRVGVWPVGLVGGVMVERPLVTSGQVSGWLTQWRPDRTFATDMAGFAVNVRLLLNHPTVGFSLQSERGFLETDLLNQLGITWSDLEVKADLCTKVLVWHTQTRKVDLKGEVALQRLGKPSTDVGIEV